MAKNSDAVREFLLGWLMEFGQEPVLYDDLYASDWYQSHPLGRATEGIKGFLTERAADECRQLRQRSWQRSWQINQAGLDFVKGNDHD